MTFEEMLNELKETIILFETGKNDEDQTRYLIRETILASGIMRPFLDKWLVREGCSGGSGTEL